MQGLENAPQLVKSCCASWIHHNPDWEFRCLDATNVGQFIPLGDEFDLTRQEITAASISDIVRVLLLHEYGGVWVDATLYCNRPLDEWLPPLLEEDFFAFRGVSEDRKIASWFLAAREAGHYLVSRWKEEVLRYWKDRTRADEYFWFHHAFGSLLDADPCAEKIWSRVPNLSGLPPHAVLHGGGMFEPAKEAWHSIDWKLPVFKLSHRVRSSWPEGSLLATMFDKVAAGTIQFSPRPSPYRSKVSKFASLRVSTENLGDHVQIIAALNLLERIGVSPDFYIDRDDQICSAPQLEQVDGEVGIVLNGWFKSNRAEWPPHPKLRPIFISFHVRLFQCPELVSESSIAYLRQHEPIGGRDSYTRDLLTEKGISSFTSNCLSLTLPRRLAHPEEQTQIFVVSRDERLMSIVPKELGECRFVSHYSASADFEDNVLSAQHLLSEYAGKAKLIVTSLLHCALPALAMGIPVVMFYPENSDAGHRSDMERFSSLKELIPIHRFSELTEVDWTPGVVDVSALKLSLIENFYDMARVWGKERTPLGPFAPPEALPPP